MRRLKHKMAVAAILILALVFAIMALSSMGAGHELEPQDPPQETRESPFVWVNTSPRTREDKPQVETPEPGEEPELGPETEPGAEQMPLEAEQEPPGAEQEPPEAEQEPRKTEQTEPEAIYTYYDVPLDDRLQEYAQDLCAEYDFPCYDIVVAIIWHESGCTPGAISTTNDYGLMQINACNHEWLREELGVTNFLDERQNILCGIYIIQQFYHKYDDIGLALMAYNCGENGARDLWNRGIWSTYYSREIQQLAEGLTERTS